MNTLGTLPPIRHVVLRGSHAEVGRLHGEMFTEEIRASVANRMELVEAYPVHHGGCRSREEILELGRHCYERHLVDFPGLMEELHGIAEGAGVDPIELLIQNGFTDFRDYLFSAGSGAGPGEGCTVFAVVGDQAEDGHPLLGQTWDMHTTAVPFVVLLQIEVPGEPPVLMFSLVGCVGMMGLNGAGVGVLVNNLHASRGRPGVFWPFVNRHLLAYEKTSEAVRAMRGLTISGAHNYLIGDSEGEILAIEQMPQGLAEELVTTTYVHTNHCLDELQQSRERRGQAVIRESSEERLRLGREFLQNADRPVGVEDLMALTRLPAASPGGHAVCMRPRPEFEMQSCGACILSPRQRTLWALWGLPSENDYHAFHLG